MMDNLLELETKGWQALSRDGDAAKEFYKEVLHDDGVMLFPGGIQFEGKENILQSLAAQPWETFTIQEPKILSVSKHTKILRYKVTAKRAGENAYNASISSTYVFEKEQWKLIFHQHTPE